MPTAIDDHTRYINGLATRLNAERWFEYERMIGDGWWCDCTVRVNPDDTYVVTINETHWRGLERTLAQLVAALPDAANIVAREGRCEIESVFARAAALRAAQQPVHD